MNGPNRWPALLLVASLVLLATLIAAPAVAQVSTHGPGDDQGAHWKRLADAGEADPGAGGGRETASANPLTPGTEPTKRKKDEKDAGDWDVIVYPYLWGPNINYDAYVGGVGTSGTATVDELLKDLNFGVMGGVEVQYKRRWFAGVEGFLALLYAKTETDPVTTSLGPVRVTSGPLVLTIPSITAQVGTVQVRADVTQLISLGYFGYRLHSGPVPDFLGGAGPADEKRLDVDAYVGGRLWYNKVTIDANGPPIFFPSTTGTVTPVGRPNLDLREITIPAVTTGPIDVHVEKTIWWVDPVIGGRLRLDLSDRHFLRIMGDVGGFNWGDASKFTWQGWAMLGRRVKKNWTIEAGYRGLGITREKSGNRMDLVYHGPVFGASYRF